MRQGLDPVRQLELGYVWVTLPSTTTIMVDNEPWYLINENEYVQAKYLLPFRPSKFHGQVITQPGMFAFIIFTTWTSKIPGAAPSDEDTRVLHRYSQIELLDAQTVTVRLDGEVSSRTWYKVGEQEWIEQGMVGIIRAKPRPDGVGPMDKWVEIDLYEQTLTAYEGDTPVYGTLISSGLPYWQTERGLYRVEQRVRERKMSGQDGQSDYYFLEDVPWTLYFFHGYALHGAYWHDRFGIMHSHGCVNMSLADSQWLFEWAPKGVFDEGMWVWVHDGGVLTEEYFDQNYKSLASR